MKLPEIRRSRVSELEELVSTTAEMAVTLNASFSALDENECRLSDIIRGTKVGTWEWRIDTGETHFNERWPIPGTVYVTNCHISSLLVVDSRDSERNKLPHIILIGRGRAADDRGAAVERHLLFLRRLQQCPNLLSLIWQEARAC